MEVVGEYFGHHRDWTDTLVVAPSGRFFKSDIGGNWTLSNGRLRLSWDTYEPEELSKTEGGFSGGNLFLFRKLTIPRASGGKNIKRIVGVHRKDESNAGDTACSPLNYLSFGVPTRTLDVNDKRLDNDHDENTLVIMGGGGLLYFGRRTEAIAGRARNVVLWGMGMDSHGKKIDEHPAWLSRYSLVGLRDNVGHARKVPCASCLSPFFDRQYKSKNDIVVYQHKDHPITITEDFPRMTNKARFQDIVPFIASGETVITNSYHGSYWAALMGKNVLIWKPFSSKFYYCEFGKICDETNWKDKVGQPAPAKIDVGSCRSANLSFATDIATEFTFCP